jgi:hypothetical protein
MASTPGVMVSKPDRRFVGIFRWPGILSEVFDSVMADKGRASVPAIDAGRRPRHLINCGHELL